MLLRWFMLFYDLEVIEEEAFLKWKEDVNDEYPGKGKALFQVKYYIFLSMKPKQLNNLPKINDVA